METRSSGASIIAYRIILSPRIPPRHPMPGEVAIKGACWLISMSFPAASASGASGPDAIKADEPSVGHPSSVGRAADS